MADLCAFTDLGKAEELHVVRAPNRHGVSNILCIDTLDIRTIDSPRVTALGVIGLCALRLVVVVAEDAYHITQHEISLGLRGVILG